MLNVVRTDISSYQGEGFYLREKKELESIEGIRYLDSSKLKEYHPDILITNTHTDFLKMKEKEEIDFNKIKLIIHPNSGHDNFSVDFVQKVNFPIVIGNPIRAQAVANYILSCLFNHLSLISHHKEWNNSRIWDRDLINEKTILLIGYGAIGKILAPALIPLASKLYVVDPYKEEECEDFIFFNDLKEVKIESCDIVLLSLGLNPTSFHLIDSDFLKTAKKNLLLINAARGKLVDQKALICFLKSNLEAYAYLDVFESEPFSHNEFEGVDNLTTSSHIAGVYKNLNQEILNFEKQVLKDFVEVQNDLGRFKDEYEDLLLENRIRDGNLI